MQVAVFGLGYWGATWVHTLNKNPEVDRIVGIDPGRVSRRLLDLSPSKLEVSTDPQRVLEDRRVTAAIVATPAQEHYPVARRCLEFNKHVLLEKPAALSLRTCRELVQQAEARGLVLMAGHTSLFTPEMRCVKQTVSQGRLGTLVSFDSFHGNFGIPETNIDVIWDLAPHPLSLFSALFSERVSKLEVAAHIGWQGRADAGYWVFGTPQGAVGHGAVSWRSPVKRRTWTVGGTKGTLVVDEIAERDRVRFYHADERRIKTSNGAPPAESLPLDEFEPLQAEFAHFLECVNEERAALSGGQHLLNVTGLLCRMHQRLGGMSNGG